MSMEFHFVFVSDPYMNYSTVSAPNNSNIPGTNQIESSESLPALQNCSQLESKVHNNPIVLDKFEEEEWDASMNSSLPTEFDLRPDLTPTGDEPNTISFETPMVRSSPSQMSHNSSASNDDSDETLEQVSEIVDQTPSTYQQKREISSLFKKFDRVSEKRAKLSSKKCLAMLGTSLLSALIIIMMLMCLLIIVLEADASVFKEIRKLPEMIIFNRDYYQPFKKSILESLQEGIQQAEK